MVKGVSRQVIVVHAPDPKLFDQAIFILKDDAVNAEGVTDEVLLREAKKLIARPSAKRQRLRFAGPLWGLAGAAFSSLLWILSLFL